MRDTVHAGDEALDVPESANSHDGYAFSPAADRWRLNNYITISLTFLREVSPQTSLGFRLALTRYAEEFSAHHTENMRDRVAWFIRDTKTDAVTAAALINWRAQLDSRNEWKLGGLKGFLLAWHGWEFPGVSDEVASLLRGWRLKGNEKGKAVAQGDPDRGALSDIEALGILDWANGAVSRGEFALETYAYFLTVMMTARRPIQIAALRGSDLTTKTDRQNTARYGIRFPRAKQRGGGFRQHFRQLPVIEDLYLTLRTQHEASVTNVEKALRCAVPAELAQQIPIFINRNALNKIADLAALRDILMGDTPDRLHATTGQLTYRLNLCSAACTARSERTGKRIHLTATRFRYTRGTNLRKEGFGAEEIAGALDQSDMQQVAVYTENTVQEAEIINRLPCDTADYRADRVVCGRGRNTTISESAGPCGRLELDFAPQTAAYAAVGPVRRPRCQRPKRIFRPCSRRVAFGSPPRQILHSTPNQPASCITSRRILHMPSIPRHRLVLRIRSPSRCAQRRERRLCGVCVILIRVRRTYTHRWARRALHSRDGRALSQEIYATFGSTQSCAPFQAPRCLA